MGASTLIRNSIFSILLLALSFGAFGGGDNGFPFEPAPLLRNIEGTWITPENEFNEQVVFKFCILKSGKVQLARAEGLAADAPLRYIYTMPFGPEPNSVNRRVYDRQFRGSVHMKISTYFREGKRGEVLLGMSVLESKLKEPKLLFKSIMKRVDHKRPAHCDGFELAGGEIGDEDLDF